MVVLGAVGGQVDPLAHENPTPIHHVAPDGRDAGDCADRSYPCLTIPYALAKADKGDEIRVAGGFFDFRPEDPAEAIQLLSPIIPVRGSFDARFVEQNVADTPTILRGPPASRLPALEQRGLLVAHDGAASPGVATRRSPSSPGAVRHVIPGGGNTDDCTREAPCALDSALAVAESGDTVLLAGGDYRIRPDAVADLIRADILVRGGFLEAWGFAAAAPAIRPSYITGPGFEHRKALAARGLTLVHDRKALAIGALTADGGPTRRADTVQGPTSCDSGTGMAGTFPCKGIGLLAHMPLDAFSSAPSLVNDIWGFADASDNREYAVIGLSNGTAVVDVTDPSDPREVGTIGGHHAMWRDIKVYQRVGEDGSRRAYAYVTADLSNERQGLQVIDLSGLPDSISLAATYRGFSRAHNLHISNVNHSTGVALPGREPLAFILGSDKGNGAPHALSLQDPLAPVEVVPALMVEGDAAGARYGGGGGGGGGGGRRNRGPQAVGALADRALEVGAPPVSVDVAPAFRDRDRDPLTYAAESSAAAVASASAAGGVVTVTAVSAGEAVVTVTATDAGGSNRSATQRFAVTVSSDVDGDGLIGIWTPAQLDAVRHDLDGDGDSTPAGAALYAAAFGLPDGGMLSCAAAGACAGYELGADLDLDTNGSGGADAGDAYWHGGAGWLPLGTAAEPFAATFEGNGHRIRGLHVQRGAGAGLFGETAASGVIRHVGVVGADVEGTHAVGGLVGVHGGVITGSYVTGRVSGTEAAGGLVGASTGRIGGSYATAQVSSGTSAGGLAGVKRRPRGGRLRDGSGVGRAAGGWPGGVQPGVADGGLCDGPGVGRGRIGRPGGEQRAAGDGDGRLLGHGHVGSAGRPGGPRGRHRRRRAADLGTAGADGLRGAVRGVERGRRRRRCRGRSLALRNGGTVSGPVAGRRRRRSGDVAGGGPPAPGGSDGDRGAGGRPGAGGADVDGGRRERMDAVAGGHLHGPPRGG